MCLIGAAGLLTVVAGPASAARVTHDSFTMTGTIADASWSAEGEAEPAVGTPQVLYAMGADATTVHRVPGARPERGKQPALIAMGLTMPGIQPGDDPYEAELWCLSEDFTFTVADDLSEAELQIPTCEAQVVVYDEETGQEAPNGVTVTMSVSVAWSATGPLELQRSHSWYTAGGSWTMDTSRTSMRSATADITITGLPGGPFEEATENASLQTVKAATLTHQ